MLATITCLATFLFAASDAAPVTDEQLLVVLKDLDHSQPTTRAKAGSTLVAMITEDRVKDGRQFEQVTSRLSDILASKSYPEFAATLIARCAKKRPERCKVFVPALLSNVGGYGECESMLALGAIGPHASAALPKLREYIRDTDPIEKTYAAAAIANIQPENDEGLRWLEQWLRDEDPVLRRCAAFGLKTCAPHSKSKLKTLREALSDPNGAVRVRVAEALWEIDPKADEVIPVFVHALSEEDESAFVRPIDISEWTPGHRIAAAGNLGRIGSRAEIAIPALTAALDDEDIAFAWVATRALGSIGKSATSALQKALEHKSPEVRQAAKEELEKLEPSAGKGDD